MEDIRKFIDVSSGYGSGDGYGYGSGFGDGYGFSDGSGSGYGYGNGDGIIKYNGKTVYQIDDVPTIISRVYGNVAKGYILNNNLTLSPCYIAKGQNMFAHGETLRKAVEALQEKIYANMDSDTVIEMFLNEFNDSNKKYPAHDFYIWHNRLTGSCEMGRKKFISDHGYDINNDTFTVQEFINITKNDFGGDVIRKLEKTLKEREHE